MSTTTQAGGWWLFRVVIEPSTARAPLPRVAAKKPLAPPRSLAGRFPRSASSARPITGCVIVHRLRNHDRLCCVIAGLRRRRRERRGRCEELWCVNQWPVPMRSRVEGYGRGWTRIIVERSRKSVVAIWRLLGRCDACRKREGGRSENEKSHHWTSPLCCASGGLTN